MRNRLTRGQKALQEVKDKKMREVWKQMMEELSKHYMVNMVLITHNDEKLKQHNYK